MPFSPTAVKAGQRRHLHLHIIVSCWSSVPPTLMSIVAKLELLGTAAASRVRVMAPPPPPPRLPPPPLGPQGEPSTCIGPTMDRARLAGQ